MGDAVVGRGGVGIALSVQQPWAWLIVNGYKDIENRSWGTRRRGETLIHAGKKIDAEGYNWIEEEMPDILLPDSFEVGGIVGSVRIVDCVEKSASRWFFGPFGFVLADARRLPFMRTRGHLGFFPVTLPSDGTTTTSSAPSSRVPSGAEK